MSHTCSLTDHCENPKISQLVEQVAGAWLTDLELFLDIANREDRMSQQKIHHLVGSTSSSRYREAVLRCSK